MTENIDLAPTALDSLGTVPLIDMSGSRDEVVRKIDDACRTIGFFNIVGHGIPAIDEEQAVAAARAYFALPHSAKRAQLRTRDNPWGYYDRELTKEQRDRKEVFDIGPDIVRARNGTANPFDGVTPWPSSLPVVEQAMKAWFGGCTDLSMRLSALIAEALGDQVGAIMQAFSPDHTSFLRLNHYPVDDLLGEAGAGSADLGIHHHTDAGAFTLLLQDGVKGLQVFRDGRWYDVTAVPGALTVNIGDMVQVWSNDLYRAPIHRVLAMSQSDRLSLAYFYNPSYDAIVKPVSTTPRYHPLNWGEFRRRRADGDFASYGTEVQIDEWRLD